MKEFNEKEYRFLNMHNWEDYRGEGIAVATTESVNSTRILDYKVINTINKGTPHGSSTALTFLETAPDASLHSLPYRLEDIRAVDYILANDIKVVFSSTPGYKDDNLEKNIDLLKSKGVIFLTSGGNCGDTIGDFTKTNQWINVASAGISKRDRLYNIELEHEYLDFAGLGCINIPSYKDKTFPIVVNGTSFSTPFLAGLVARVLQFFREKTGSIPCQEQIIEFLKENSWNDGLSKEQVGHGLFILPNPQDIDINKYI